MVGTPGNEELPYIEAGLAHDCFVSLMGGADRPELWKGLEENKKVKLTDELKEDFSREFFFGLENYELFSKAKPRLVQCTSCNTTGLSRLALAARPLGLTAVLGNIDRRHGDPHTVVRASPSAIQFGKERAIREQMPERSSRRSTSPSGRARCQPPSPTPTS